MKILLLDQYGDLGGAQLCLLDLMPEFASRNWKLIVASPQGPLLERARRHAQIALLALPALRSTHKPARDWVRFVMDTPALARRLAVLIGAHRPDVIYVNGPRLVPALALVKPSVPCVFHSHHFIAQTGARRAVQLGLRRLGATIIANCRHVGVQWAGPANVIYNGVEGASYREPGRMLRIGVVGRVSSEKGQVVFLEAVRLLGVGKDREFVVIGAPMFGDASAEEYLQKLRHDAPQDVVFTGWIDNALEQLDLLVVSSIGSEATTRVIPEAWAAGVPVIASRIGGIAEIVEDNRTGFLVEPNSPTALAACIAKVLALETAELSKITLAARRVYEERFTRERYAREIADLLVRVAAF